MTYNKASRRRSQLYLSNKTTRGSQAGGHLIRRALPALLPVDDVLMAVVELVDEALDDAPPMLDGALAAHHAHLVEVLGEPALVELVLDPGLVGGARLVCAGDLAGSNGLP